MTIAAPSHTLVTHAPLDIKYPESDGKPMAETEVHVLLMLDTIAILREFFRTVVRVYVAGNMLFYYKKGHPHRSVAPDVFVVFGVGKQQRRTYKLWEEGVAPAFVLEFTSESTSAEDVEEKYELYEQLGVQEYFLFDPLEDYLEPSFQAFRLQRKRYQPIVPERDGSFLSQTLELKLHREGQWLRFTIAATGEKLLTPTESYEKTRAEREARIAAEAELERLRAELATLRNK